MLVSFMWGVPYIPASFSWTPHVAVHNDPRLLPTAHACYYEIELPDTDYETFRRKMIQAINFAGGSYGEA